MTSFGKNARTQILDSERDVVVIEFDADLILDTQEQWKSAMVGKGWS